MSLIRRVLKPSGTLYLHCDPTASHYLKVLLDALFNPVLVQGASAKMPHTLITGRDGKKYQTYELTGAGLRNGETGKKWRGFDPNTLGRHWGNTPSVMDDWDSQGLIHWPSNGGWPRRRAAEPFVPEDRMVAVGDVWDDIDRLNQTAKERVGYPTQKPVALLERIVTASTKVGDVVLDPFCGCGTAVVAAQKLDRKWIGIDITHVAVSVLKKRLDEEFPGLEYRVRGEPEDVASARRLAEERWEEFQAWIVDKVDGIPLNPEQEKKVAKKGKDGGIDGYFLFRDDPKAPRSNRMVLSVKGGESLNPGMVDALFGVVSRENATSGALLTAHPPTSGMMKTALAYGHYSSELFAPGKKYPKIQIVSVEDIFDPKWRGLIYPGANTSKRSEPPPAPGIGTGATQAKGGTRKGGDAPVVTREENFKLKPSEPRKTKPKQQTLALKAPGARGKK